MCGLDLCSELAITRPATLSIDSLLRHRLPILHRLQSVIASSAAERDTVSPPTEGRSEQ